MLAEYNGQIFNAEIHGEQVYIWKYAPVAGFQKSTTERGIVYYEKTVPLDDIKEFFSITFFAFADERKFVITYLEEDELNVLCDDREYAETHGFTEMEHGVWISQKSLKNFDRFQVVKSVEDSDEKHVFDVEKNHISKWWEKYVTNVERLSIK